MTQRDTGNQTGPGPVKRFVRATLGPVTMVKQSIGTNTGSYLKDQYHHWRDTSYVAMAPIIEQRHRYDLEEKCRENRKTEADVRAAYKNVRVIMGAFWIGIVFCLFQLTTMDIALGTAFLSLIGVVSLVVSLIAAAHHQTCIREKQFLSTAETMAYLLATPSALFPVGLPHNWKLYSRPNVESQEGKRKRIRRLSDKK